MTGEGVDEVSVETGGVVAGVRVGAVVGGMVGLVSALVTGRGLDTADTAELEAIFEDGLDTSLVVASGITAPEEAVA